jgi:large subunit ribosomal protein L15
MDLSNLTVAEGSRKKRNRKGRGPGSGNGKTAGRGMNGQKSRSGGSVSAHFEGGQMPLQRRLPKRGFKNRFAIEWAIVNLAELETHFEGGAVVDADVLAGLGLIWSRSRTTAEGEKVLVTKPLKVLARGTLSKALTVKAKKFSKAAEEQIAAAGGSAEVI